MERLAPRVGAVWVVAALVRTAAVGALLVGAAVAVTRFEAAEAAPFSPVLAAAALALLGAAVGAVVALRRYGVWRFEVRNDAVYVERGVFTRRKTVVPFVRLQHVDSRRGPVERAVGLATVVVYTAGSRSADVAIPGLTPARAEELRERLRRLAVESEGADAV